MAKFDIMPFTSRHGGSTEVRWGEMTASENFEIGEPVMLVAAGTLTEPTDDAAQWTVAQMDTGQVAGIAAWGPGETTQGSGGTAPNLNVATGVAYATGDNLPYWPTNQGTLFITNNYYAAGGGSAVAPALTDIGIAYQIVYGTFGTPDAGWGVEQTAAAVGVDVQAIIVDVLDSTKDSIRLTGNTGVFIVFEINNTLAAA